MDPPATTPLASFGFTWNQAVPSRGTVSPAGVTAVFSSPQTVPPAVSVCCIRSSPPSSLLGEPFCGGLGGLAYASDLITTLDTVGRAPAASAVTYRFCWSMPILGWSAKHGQPRPPGSVESMVYSFHSPSGSFACRTAISSVPTVPVSFRNTMIENQVVVAGSYQQRGSLVNSLPPTLNRSLMLNGPRIDLPLVRKMRYAELTGSSTNPLASHSPWSGGSNSRP